MIRGAQTLTAIFPKSFEPETNRKGKRSALAVERDICLSYRFYYHFHLSRRRLDDAVVELEREFFITGATILSCLTKNDGLLKDIVSNNPDKRQLQRRYPNFNWN